jgi:threonine dehydrogenase-like Zn-dependent dehydrogenase
MGSMAVLHSFELALALAATGAVDGDVLVTHRVPLDDYLEAVELVRRGEGLKVLLTPGKTG